MMQPTNTKRLAFKAEWFHVEAGITHTYLLTFHLSDSAVEVVSLNWNYIPLKY